MADLADNSRKRGDLVGAAAGFRRALAHFDLDEPIRGLMTRLNLALVELERGRFADARIQQERALAMASGSQAHLLHREIAHIGLMASTAALEDWQAFTGHRQRFLELNAVSQVADPDHAWTARLAGDEALANGNEHVAAACWGVALQQWERLGDEQEANDLRGLIAALR